MKLGRAILLVLTVLAITALLLDNRPPVLAHSMPRVAAPIFSGNNLFQTHVDYATAYTPYSVAVGDFNGDGKADLVTANYGVNTVSVLLGNGDGTFQTHVDYGAGNVPYSVAVGDFNGDGKGRLREGWE